MAFWPPFFRSQRVEPPRPSMPPIPLKNVNVQLHNAELWDKFEGVQTEMIITKSGRHMFPKLEYKITGLEPGDQYLVFLEFKLTSNKRHKFITKPNEEDGTWVEYSHADLEAHNYNKFFMYNHNPMRGTDLMAKVINFKNLKVTNNPNLEHSNIVLQSMHKYLPRLWVIKYSRDPFIRNGVTPMLHNLVYYCESQVFEFHVMEFIAVTAYQNKLITQLKINNNPFAKGFREGDSKRKRRSGSEDNEEEPFSPKRCRIDETSRLSGESSPFGDESFSEDSPMRGESSEIGCELSPAKSDTSSMRGESSLIRRESSPARSDTSSMRGESLHIGCESSPMRSETSPMRGESSHIGRESSPLRSETSPMRGEVLPNNSPLPLIFPNISRMFPTRREMYAMRSELLPMRNETFTMRSEMPPMTSEMSRVRSESSHSNDEFAPLSCDTSFRSVEMSSSCEPSPSKSETSWRSCESSMSDDRLSLEDNAPTKEAFGNQNDQSIFRPWMGDVSNHKMIEPQSPPEGTAWVPNLLRGYHENAQKQLVLSHDLFESDDTLRERSMRDR